MRKLVIQPEAQSEYEDGISEFKKIKKELARRFAKEVKKSLKLLRKMPKIHGIVVRDIRRAVVRGFPYVILYRVTDTEVIVLAIFHTRRDPSDWQSRI